MTKLSKSLFLMLLIVCAAFLAFACSPTPATEPGGETPGQTEQPDPRPDPDPDPGPLPDPEPEIPAGYEEVFIPHAALSSVTLSDPGITVATASGVHDPSIFRDDDGTYYLFSTHGNVTVHKSADLIRWTRCAAAIQDLSQIEAAAEYVGSGYGIWAPDVFKGPDGKYWLYYSVSKSGSGTSAIGLVKADKAEGPYTRPAGTDGIVVKSSGGPNAIDPVILREEGTGKLYMGYGSFFGGIYMLELNRVTGLAAKPGDKGVQIAGGNGSALEGAYIRYNPYTEHYYLFVSYGYLGSEYNIRVARSRSVTGPYVDYNGKNLISGSYIDKEGVTRDGDLELESSNDTVDRFNDVGYKLLGGIDFTEDGSNTAYGIKAPGHNSVYNEGDDWYLVSHCRHYTDGGYNAQVRRLYFNKEGWPCVAPFAYAGETMAVVESKDVTGAYLWIDQGTDIRTAAKTGVRIVLNADGTIDRADASGAVTEAGAGSYKLVCGAYVELTIGDVTAAGYFLPQWDPVRKKQTMTFSAMSTEQHSWLGFKA